MLFQGIEDRKVQHIYLPPDKMRPTSQLKHVDAVAIWEPLASLQCSRWAMMLSCCPTHRSLLACDADGSSERTIEQFNTKLLAGLQIGEAKLVIVEGFGGEAVQMWVVSPPGYTADTKKKWPLMRVIHGGPHTCWSDTWHWRWNMQMFAASG